MSQPKHTPAQAALIHDLCPTYGIDPEDVIFFKDDDRPFLTYEAAAVMLRKLVPNLSAINLSDPVNAFDTSLLVRCSITIDGFESSAPGVVDASATADDGYTLLNGSQLYANAAARATRAAMRAAGIDLIKLHFAAKSGEPQTDFTGADPKANFHVLQREAHVLGEEAGLIVKRPDGEGKHVLDKTGWKNHLMSRYEKESSAYLSEEQMGDLVASLKMFIRKPQQLKQAA